jgi:hypothetical protein
VAKAGITGTRPHDIFSFFFFFFFFFFFLWDHVLRFIQFYPACFDVDVRLWQQPFGDSGTSSVFHLLRFLQAILCPGHGSHGLFMLVC